MSNYTVPVRLSNDFLAEAAPILDDSFEYVGDDEYMVAMAPVAAKLAEAKPAADWSVTIEVTAEEAALLMGEAAYRMTFDIDIRTSRSLQADIDRLVVAERRSEVSA